MQVLENERFRVEINEFGDVYKRQVQVGMKAGAYRKQRTRNACPNSNKFAQYK